MANVLHRITKEYLTSVNTPDFKRSEWIINPDLTAVETAKVGLPYWKIDGDQVLPMTTAEQADYNRVALFHNMTLDEAKAAVNEQINVMRDTKLDGGWVYNGVEYDSDPVSRQNMAGTMTLISSGYTLPADFTWRSKNNTNHFFDNAGFIQFYQASCAWVQAIFRNSWDMKEEMWALTSISELADFEVDVGYPKGWPTQTP